MMRFLPAFAEEETQIGIHAIRSISNVKINNEIERSFYMAQQTNGQIIIGEGRGFDRIRRITGYLVGTIDRWNDAKRAEEKDRVKHGMVK